MNEPVLSVHDLSKYFYRTTRWPGRRERFAALSGINFSLRRGETVGIVGESGSGKSTLARLLVRLYLPDEGTVSYCGRDYQQFHRQGWAARVQMVFQESATALNPKVTVKRTLEEVVPDRQRIRKLLEQCGLSARLLQLYPWQLSGGQRQRIGIVRALLPCPEIVVLDEPVSSLDVSLQGQVLNLLSELKETYNLTYLLISHDLQIVSYLAERVVVLAGGKVIEEGDTEAIFRQPQEVYTQRLLAAIPRF